MYIKKVLTIPDLIEANYFNGGIKGDFISKDLVFIILPKGMNVNNLHDLETKRGIAFSVLEIARIIIFKNCPYIAMATRLLLPIWAFGLTLGFTGSKFGKIRIVQGSVGYLSI